MKLYLLSNEAAHSHYLSLTFLSHEQGVACRYTSRELQLQGNRTLNTTYRFQGKQPAGVINNEEV